VSALSLDTAPLCRRYPPQVSYRQPNEIEAWARKLGADCRVIDGDLHDDFAVALTRPG